MAPMAAKHCSFPGCRESRKFLVSAKYKDVRTESIHCSKHACRTVEGYPNVVPCSKAALPGARYCDIHPSCALENCNYKKSPTKPFCHNHTCAFGDCRNSASSPNRRCEIHMPCPAQGCTKFLHKRPDGRGWYAACSIHLNKKCGLASCPKTVGLTDTYCADHICTVRGCPEQRIFDGGNCQNHTCDVNKCPLPVAHPHQVRPNNRTCAYCPVHECNIRGCHAVATVVRGHCSTHKCKVEGCNNAKSPDEYLEGHCFSHMSKNVYRKGEQAGRDAEFNEATKRREEEMDQRLKRERIQRAREERMRLEEKIDSLERENQRLQAENASIADHDTTDEHCHWYSAEPPRSGPFYPDYQYNSYQQHTGGDRTYNTPRSQWHDEDSETTVAGSTDDTPARSRPSAPYRYVYRRT